MPSYVAFLRAVNVGGRFVKMEAVRNALADSGFSDVETYIQSGNIRFTSAMRSTVKVEDAIEASLAALAGFDVPAMVRTPRELRAVAQAVSRIPPLLGPKARRYVGFAKADLPPEGIEALAAWDESGERAQGFGSHVLMELDIPSHQAKLSGARLERMTRTAMTMRDLKVVSALSEMWGA